MTPGRSRNWVVLLAMCVAVLGAVAYVRSHATPPVYSQTLYVFGTLLEIVIYG